jgi:APA family basic amino acid/polyamine antiporter
MSGAALEPQTFPHRLKPELTLFDSATIVAGSMIGSGIFIVSADIARQVESPAAILLVWIVSGVMTVAGALAYAELAAMMPEAGGQYVYLREVYGGLWAFLFGWTFLLVIQTGTIAAVAVAFARFAGVMWPALGSELWFGIGGVGLSGERLGAILVIVVLTWINLRGLELGKLVQNGFTTAKILSLMFIVAVGCLFAPNPAAVSLNFGSAQSFFGTAEWLSLPFAAAFGAAMVGGLFSADAWANVTFTAAEVKNPRRDLPLALLGGAAVVILLYVLTNLSYLFQLPADGSAGAVTIFGRGIAHAPSDRVASAAMEMVWGRTGAAITAIVVMISTFGCANGMILTGARVVYAMSRDRVFFQAAGELNQASAPAYALAIQAVWSCLLALSGTYSDLLDYVIFAQLLFYILTVGAVFLLRIKKPDAPRPYRAWGYPWVPALYIVAAAAMTIDLLIMKPGYTWPGVLIVASGVPIYRFVTRERSTAR